MNQDAILSESLPLAKLRSPSVQFLIYPPLETHDLVSFFEPPAHIQTSFPYKSPVQFETALEAPRPISRAFSFHVSVVSVVCATELRSYGDGGSSSRGSLLKQKIP